MNNLKKELIDILGTNLKVGAKELLQAQQDLLQKKLDELI